MNSKRKPPKKPPVGTARPHPVEQYDLKPPIERVPGLGRTWVKRGPGYWTLRVIIALMLTFILIVGCFMTGGLGYGLWQSGLPLAVRILLMLVIVAAIVRSMIKAWSAFILVGRSNRTAHPITLAEAAGDTTTPRERQRMGVSAAVRGMASGGLLAISVVANFGWLVVPFISGFQKYYLGEAIARANLQRWCDENAMPNPLSAGGQGFDRGEAACAGGRVDADQGTHHDGRGHAADQHADR